MRVTMCALGVVQKRGNAQIAPQLMGLGPSESDYFARHVARVRDHTLESARADFAPKAATPSHMAALRDAALEDEFVDAAVALQNMLAAAMRASTSAKDCVFAALRTEEGSDRQVTLLKLDAVVEAAQWKLLTDGSMDFKVLTDLLPEPGDLQKGISWPDPRTDSEVLTVDRNSVAAQYFESAFQLRVSQRPREAEMELVSKIAELASPAAVPEVLRRIREDATLDVVYESLADLGQGFADAAVAERQAERPPAKVRAAKVGGQSVTWRVEGIKVSVPVEMLGRIEKRRVGDGWELVIATRTEPRISPR